MPVVLHLVEPLLCLWAVPSLPQPLHIEACCFGAVVFWGARSFLVRQPCLAVCVTVIVTLVGQDLCIVCVVCVIVALVEQAVGFVIRRAIALVVCKQEMFIVS